MHKYRNPWHRPGVRGTGPEIYSTPATPKKYRGFLIFSRVPRVWDVVKDSVCIGQRAGVNGAKRLIDLIHDDPDNFWAQRAMDDLRRHAPQQKG